MLHLFPSVSLWVIMLFNPVTFCQILHNTCSKNYVNNSGHNVSKYYVNTTQFYAGHELTLAKRAS